MIYFNKLEGAWNLEQVLDKVCLWGFHMKLRKLENFGVVYFLGAELFEILGVGILYLQGGGPDYFWPVSYEQLTFYFILLIFHKDLMKNFFMQLYRGLLCYIVTCNNLDYDNKCTLKAHFW